MSNVVQLPTKGTSVDEAMAWLKGLHERGELKHLLVIADTKDGYDVGFTKNTAVNVLYMSTYMQETVMRELRSNELMPSAD